MGVPSICTRMRLLRNLLRELRNRCLVVSEECVARVNRVAELLGEIISDLCGE